MIDTARVSGQSDAEQEDFDIPDGNHIKANNENNYLPHAGEGPRLRTSKKKQKIGIIYCSVLLNTHINKKHGY